MTEVRHWRDALPGEYAVVGDPLSHTLSPAMHNALYRSLGLPWVYRGIRVPAEEFTSAMDHLTKLRYRGVNVTVPLKEIAYRWCDSVQTPALAINAIKLKDRIGANTDVPAFLNTLKEFCGGKKVLVLGAGGTAKAILPGLVQMGYEVSAWNRTAWKLIELADQTQIAGQIRFVDQPIALGFDVVVNTTSAGLSDESPPVEWTHSEACAYDVGYRLEGQTPFLATAAMAGLRTQDGKPMLVEQGALAFEWWTGQNASRAVMTEALSCP